MAIASSSVWHDMPLPMHADAPLAAQAGREAYAQKGPSAFWALHDKMFANQQKLKRDDLDGYAKELNLNMDKWKAALDGSTHASEIDADKKAGNDDAINGTPGIPYRARRRQQWSTSSTALRAMASSVSSSNVPSPNQSNCRPIEPPSPPRSRPGGEGGGHL